MLKTICLALHLCSSISGPAYVYDGDTVKVAGIAVRLWGLDCEEKNEPNGPPATQAMRLLLARSAVTCELTGARSYNRMVGRCYLAGHDIAQTMVAGGYCLDCAHYDGGYYRKDEPAGVRARLMQKPYC